ncbi:hypothetical protein L204_101324 [Cryptococcus depauperatus]
MIFTIPLILSFFVPALARQITVKNSCSSTIWPGMHTGAGTTPVQATGWELKAGQQTKFEVPEDWTAGRIWARTGCVNQDGKFQCLTGQCEPGAGGGITCANSDQPPATLAEFTLLPNAEDNYDISLVDGFNIPLSIIPSISSCQAPRCEVNINQLCPSPLRTSLDKEGVNLGCISPCNAGFGQEIYGNRACCTGAYANATLCQSCGFDYYDLFKDNCKTSYAYAYDEKSKTALWTCGGRPNYLIEFCPAKSDYVGSKKPSDKYASATATCSNIATTFTSTFSVPPSPTTTASTGTLNVVATVSTGVDGAAAVQVTPSDTKSGTGSSGGPPASSTSTVMVTEYVTVNGPPPSSGSAGSGSTATGSTATGSTATGSTATGSTATGSTATGSTATGSAGSSSTATGSAGSSSDPPIRTTKTGGTSSTNGAKTITYTVIESSTLFEVISDPTTTAGASGPSSGNVLAIDTTGKGQWLSAVPHSTHSQKKRR